jgi:hypothetical protein
MRYRANVAVDGKAPGESKTIPFEHDVYVSIKGHAWACGLTAIAYGGWCWSYLFHPFSSHEEKTKEDAINALNSTYGASKYRVLSFETRQIDYKKANYGYDSLVLPGNVSAISIWCTYKDKCIKEASRLCAGNYEIIERTREETGTSWSMTSNSSGNYGSIQNDGYNTLLVKCN